MKALFLNPLGVLTDAEVRSENRDHPRRVLSAMFWPDHLLLGGVAPLPSRLFPPTLEADTVPPGPTLAELTAIPFPTYPPMG